MGWIRWEGKRRLEVALRNVRWWWMDGGDSGDFKFVENEDSKNKNKLVYKK